MSVASSYAKALFEAAAEGKSQSELSKACDEIESQLGQLVTLMTSSKEAKVALTSPVTTSKEKAALIQALTTKAGAAPMVSRFATLLASKGRFGLLPEVRDVFTQVRLGAEGGVSGRLEAAEPMSDADVAALAKAFEKKLGRKIAFRVSTNPALLAGVRVTVNGVTYDGTLKSQLDQLRDKISATARAV